MIVALVIGFGVLAAAAIVGSIPWGTYVRPTDLEPDTESEGDDEQLAS